MVKIENRELSMADLAKGDYISQDVIRIITGFDPHENYDKYRLETLKLREKIEKARTFHMRGEGWGFRILTDSEDVIYQQQQWEAYINKLRKVRQRASEIDENNLDVPTLDRHRRNLLNTSRELTALDRERKQIRSEDKQHKSPTGMPPSRLTFVSSQGDKENGSKATDSETERILATDPSQRLDGESAASVRQTTQETDQQTQ